MKADREHLAAIPSRLAEVDTEIIQKAGLGRTSLTPFQTLAMAASIRGAVRPDVAYIVVDALA
jgi:hypothetical protein